MYVLRLYQQNRECFKPRWKLVGRYSNLKDADAVRSHMVMNGTNPAHILIFTS